ncbi:GNAT family N-acetyltransferase [Chengkuizengella axinellae]|uniref:GNAT family N-acetyltransferase n=1 Tax=Chengkuizengella axinellae TaxID=3064388 RepID=A0ABT9J4B7_9BACL|nr:GNAT family N-acetyltransferase [Chengkuizengella sp. 2205SS18-9]MDP5276441.1 GNAT family N-acetyltransferase [Chengkuizengella sp. 2205SS18-9]
MSISVNLSNKANKYVIHNLYPLYLYDLAEIWGRSPNKFGVFEEDDTKTLLEQNTFFDIWWEKDNVLFPHLISVDDIPVGLAFVATPPFTPEKTDFIINEFFLLRFFRGRGIAEQAAIMLFNQYKGRWGLYTNCTDNNIRTLRFWRKTLGNYTNSNYVEEQQDTPDGVMTFFGFNNADF